MDLTFESINIEFDDSLKLINVNAFSGRPLESFRLWDIWNLNPNGVDIFVIIKNFTMLETLSLRNCNITFIPYKAFDGLTHLNRIEILDKLTLIEQYAF